MIPIFVLFVILCSTSWSDARTCTYEWTEGSVMAPCGSTDVIATVTSNTTDASSCFRECEDLQTCKSFRVRSDACVLFSCRPSGRRKGTASFGILRKCVFDTVASASPSASPTSYASTPEWSSPSGIPQTAPIPWETFVVPYVSSSCEIVRPARGARVVSFPRWGGTIDDCVRECAYDNRCGGVTYSNVTRICTKATSLETTDVLDFPDKSMTVAYAKIGSPVSYWAGLCSQGETQETCDALAPLCVWNQGKRGVNQVRIMFDGWCSRSQC